MNILHIDSSILSDGSVSRQLSAEIMRALTDQRPDASVTYLDLATHPVGHLTAFHMAAAQDAEVPSELTGDVAAGRQSLEAFVASDVVVIGAPMYNFSIPSQLKAWIDRIAVSGVTFTYSDKGPQGLMGGKKIIIASSRGGVFSADAPYAMFDHQEPYLTAFFGFLGITDVTFVRAEGVAMSPDAREASIKKAVQQAHALRV